MPNILDILKNLYAGSPATPPPDPGAQPPTTTDIGLSDITLPHQTQSDQSRAPFTSTGDVAPGPVVGLQQASPASAAATLAPNAVNADTSGPITPTNAPQVLARLRQQQKSELEDRVNNLTRAGDTSSIGGNPGDLQALQNMLGSVQNDIAQDPYTGQAAQARTAGIDAANTNAIMQGFTGNAAGPLNPAQQAAKAARDAEAAKVNVPIAVEKAREANAQQQLQQYQQMMTLHPEMIPQKMGGGANPSISFMTPAQQAVPGAGAVNAKAMEQLMSDRRALDGPLSGKALTEDAASKTALGRALGYKSIEEQKARLDAQIAQMRGRPATGVAAPAVNAPGQGPAPAQTGGAPTAPAGWKYVPKAGGGWTAVQDTGSR